MEIQEFSPAKAEIQSAILEVEGLTIGGVDDEAGYEAVKVGKKRLADMRIKITKFGKEQREEAIKWQKEVLRQEKELVGMIDPVESKLKSEMDRIDEEKKRIERAVLLPARTKLLEELGIKLLDAEILRMDEKEFSLYYTEERVKFLEEKDRIAKEKEAEAKRAEELEQAKKEAAEKAVIEERERAEKEKQAEQQRIINENARIAREAVEKAEKEKAEEEKLEKNKKYKKWLEKNGVENDNKTWLIQIRKGKLEFPFDPAGKTFVLYKRIDEITI